MKTLHVHIGTPKTGTTAIQSFLKENEQILKKNGCCYPILPFTYPRVAKWRNGHFLSGVINNESGRRDREQEKQFFAEGIKIITELFQTYDNIILTDETIWRNMDVYRKHLWEDLTKTAEREQFTIHVIVYLRRQDKFISSLWNQQLKMNKGTQTELTFDSYFKKIWSPAGSTIMQNWKEWPNISAKQISRSDVLTLKHLWTEIFIPIFSLQSAYL